MNIRVKFFVLFLFITGVIGYFFYLSNTNENNGVLIFTSDLESVSGEDFIAEDYKLAGAAYQTSEHARSGTYASLLNENQEFGITHTFSNIKKGDVILFSAWRHSEEGFGHLIIRDPSKGGKYVSTNRVQYYEGDWGFVEAYFLAEEDSEMLKLYAHNPNKEAVYFDDVTVKYYSNNTAPDISHEALELKFDECVLNKITSFREEALSQGIIMKAQKEYVKASIVIDGEEIPVELRLKGDWTDHLETDKWSFRIKVKGDHAYKGLKTFSIQNPSTRGFMNEWFAHKLFDREDVLTTRYVFVPVIINGVRKGVYALEEHFDKQLLESRHRRESPIVKFDESGVWEHHKYEIDDSASYGAPILFSSDISVFKKKRTYKSIVLSNLFKVAQSQMNRYRYGDDKLGEYMDLDSYAKYIALSDVVNGKHGLIWHNQRFYFNPLTNKLEPIAYDCFTERELLEYKVRIEGLGRVGKERGSLVQSALENSELEALYIKYLKQYSNTSYLKSVFHEMNAEISKQEQLLNFENPSVSLDRAYFERNCMAIQGQLKEYETLKNKLISESEDYIYKPLTEEFLYTEIALKAYVVKKSQESMEVRLRNYHRNKINIIGYSIKANKDSLIECSNLALDRYSNTYTEEMITFNQKIKKVFYTAANCGDKIFSARVNKWDAPKDIRFVQEQIPSFVTRNSTGDFLIKSGSYSLSNDMIIPKGFRFIIEQGVALNIKNNAAIISYSPVSFDGVKTDQIHIYSSDSSANGITISAPNTSSSMTFTRFEGLKSLTKNMHSLTGAVTLFKSKLTLDDCHFEKNHSEDGLNLIQCDFTMKNCSVSETTSDGFDADFCTGKVIGCTFSNTGNDCMDFSGSQIEVVDCVVFDAGDKGISGGEHSTLIIDGCHIDGAYIAIASKDLSEVTVTDLRIDNSEYAFSAYKKKPEYGPAKIIVTTIKRNNSKQLHLLEKGSSLNYLTQKYVGIKQFNIDSMYMMYAK
ncbi:MAG: CotH kinase family protein [Crocinitomicaceae bacterium]|nr:CotH kinase family protein [Crocinitomicaceae bacterium]